MTRTFRTVAILAVTLSAIAVVPNQSQAQMGNKETQGTIAGAVLGGVVGGLIGGRGGGAVVGAIAGTAIGGLIGNRIGASLDEQDRVRLARATRAAFASGKTQSFSGSSARGRVRVLSTSHVDGKPCRTVEQVVTVKGGATMTDTVSACRGPRGWQI